MPDPTKTPLTFDEAGFKALAEFVEQQANTILQQNASIEELKSIVAGGLSVGEKVDAAKKELPRLPADPIQHKGKKLKWAFASFRLPGDPTQYLATEASTNPELIDRLLAVKGQRALVEVKE